MRLMRSTQALKEGLFVGMNIRALNAAIERKDVPGRVWRNGGHPRYFVDLDALENQTGDPLADRVLARAGT